MKNYKFLFEVYCEIWRVDNRKNIIVNIENVKKSQYVKNYFFLKTKEELFYFRFYFFKPRKEGYVEIFKINLT